MIPEGTSVLLGTSTNGSVHQERLVSHRAHVPNVIYHIISPRAGADVGHRYEGTARSVTSFASRKEKLTFQRTDHMCVNSVCSSSSRYFDAIITPRDASFPRSVNFTVSCCVWPCVRGLLSCHRHEKTEMTPAVLSPSDNRTSLT